MGLHRYSWFLFAATFLLIIAGGLVTSQDYGLAVPDWPKSYGMWMPPMVGGVFYEHGHRMIAGFVGTLTLILAVWVWMKERRRSLRFLASFALIAVILQAVLGGLTVLYKLPTPISTMHATLGQTFFCLVAAFVLVSSPGWNQKRSMEISGGDRIPRLFLMTTGFIYLQLILGSWMRHSHAALAIPDFPLAFGQFIPTFSSPEIAIHFAHRVNALIVFTLVTYSASRIIYLQQEIPSLHRLAVLLVALVLFQIALGAFTIWTRTAVPVATAHVAVGALTLATSVILTIRSFRVFGKQTGKVANLSLSKKVAAGTV